MKRISLMKSRPASDQIIHADNLRHERLQKAAAWQWFMHGTGAAQVQAPLHAEALMARSVKPGMTRASSQKHKPASTRFADEAIAAAAVSNKFLVALGAASHLPSCDYTGLSGLGSHKHQQETKAKGGYDSHVIVGESYNATGQKHVKKMKPSNDKHKRNLQFLGFQKLLHKLLVVPRSNKRNSREISKKPNILYGDDQEEVQHQYHRFIYHHHHHHYHGSLEEVEVLEQVGTRWSRRHSASGPFHQHYLSGLYSDLEEEEDEEEEEQEEQEGNYHYASSAFARRRNSERFMTTPNMKFSDGSGEKHDNRHDIAKFLSRGGPGSDRRPFVGKTLGTSKTR